VKITVVGATGLIGREVVDVLKRDGHEVIAASRSTGVDVLSGDGLPAALHGTDALVDVTNAPSFEADAVMHFFTTAATTLVAAAQRSGIAHYVLLSIVGVHRLPDSPYYRAKVAQERIVAGSGVPYTIVRATQFAEFTGAIVDSMTVGEEVRVPDALIQPIPADHVADALAQAAATEPVNGVVSIGGARRVSFEQMARDVLARKGDATTTVIVDPDSRYFGAALSRRSLVMPDSA
jgi:uncharacterized protein YbjT (DUF2867 family)